MTTGLKPAMNFPAHVVLGKNKRWLSVFGFASAFYIPAFGQLYLAEIVVLLAIAWMAVNHRFYLSYPSLRRLTVLSVLWGYGLIVSSLWNSSAVGEFITGITAVIFLVLTIQVIMFWCREYGDFERLVVGMAVGYSLAALVQPVSFFLDSPWKFGFGLPVTVLILWMATKIPALVPRCALLAGLTVLNLFGDYRSLSLLVGVVLVTDVVRTVLARNFKFPVSRVIFIMSVALVAVGFGSALSSSYTQIAESGALGESGLVRAEMQGGGSALSMLLGGRNEIFYSLPAVLSSPIVGYGTGPKITPDIAEAARAGLSGAGLDDIAESGRTQGNLPGHSFIMSSWVEAGITGLWVWLYCAVLAVRGFSFAVFELGRRWALPGFLSILLIWNIAYSPFGGSTRFFAAVTVAWMIHLVSSRRSLPNSLASDVPKPSPGQTLSRESSQSL
ncbi:hypothetical protein [Cryobacterium soli]|uniref:hypothetical protein n=1 Tax=Cryobacterium soli TaxID=2220095 RepID=UPI000E72A45D|nr:hypothetical protein [Cryobacterium soli]